MGERKEDLKGKRASKLMVAACLPSIGFLSVLICVAIIALFFGRPLLNISTSRDLWSTGPLTSHHAFIGSDCKACHQGAFERVADKSCEGCHQVASHSKNNHPANSSSTACIACHSEHEGETKLIPASNSLCTNCHASLTDKKTKTTLRNVGSFAEHPEVHDKIDHGLVRLNHKIHTAANLRGPDGDVQLQCSDCHHRDEDKKLFKPVTYARDCARCHPLSFDENLPTKVAPHGEPQDVLDFLLGEYAKQREFARLGKVTPVDSTSDRVLPARVKDDFNDPSLIASLRQAESLLFTKTGCNLCHVVSEKSPKKEDVALVDNLETHFNIEINEAPRVWLDKARFTHDPHSHFSCKSCHDGVTKSEKSSDLLIPGIEGCKECHGDRREKNGRVGLQSTCITCHDYHGEESKD